MPLLRHAGNLSRFRPRAGHDEATFLHGVCAVAAQHEFARAAGRQLNVVAGQGHGDLAAADEWQAYDGLEDEFAGHKVVDHGKGEYVSGDAYTNTAESWIALLKRGIMGSFHHVSEEHLDRYANEFAFIWDYRNVSDGERMVKAVEGIEGKRLVYKETINGKSSN